MSTWRHHPAVLLGTLTLGHVAVDMYAGFLQPLIPALREHVGVELVAMTTLAGVCNIVVNAVQPLAGWFTLRHNCGGFLLLGPALALLMALLGVPASYAVLAAVVVAAHVGIGVYHPGALVAAHDAAGPSAHVAVPVFLSGGYLGFSVGAWLSTQWVAARGFEGFWLLAIPGALVVGLIVLTGLARHHVEAPPAPRPGVSTRRDLNFYALLPLGVSVVTATSVLYMFLTVDLEARWGTGGIAWGGRALAIVGLSGAIASYLWGWLSSRVSPFALIAVGQLLCVPFFLLMVTARSSPALMLWSVPTGAFLGGGFFPLVATAARRAPQLTPTLRAGLIMGCSWGIGSVVAMACGWLTKLGVTTGQILCWTVLSMVATALLAGSLYVHRRRVQAAARPL
ncbi:MAG: MFS transporter [Planctomycetes bacterium]|nr:MFS transporter [Planctomycetota bacterium]